MATDPLADVLGVTMTVAGMLDELGVPYLVGGSLASSMHGIPRATNDVDLVADLHLAHVDALLERLGDDFYFDREAIVDAIRRRASFNIIDNNTVLKIDIFVLKDDALSQEEMRRRQSLPVATDPERRLVVATAEDIVLQKLDWFRIGGGVSERQWLDVQGVLKVQKGRLDLEYLLTRAQAAGLDEVLARALAEAGTYGA